MNLYLFEDTLLDGQDVSFGDTAARAIYVTAGQVAAEGRVHASDEGIMTDGPVILKAGPAGASLWRWDLSNDSPPAPPERTVALLVGPVPAHLAGPGSFLRLDSVSFPPGGTAMLHTHQGPGIRCLREGGIRIDTNGHSASYGPGGAWFEEGPIPVFAQADHALQSRFIRAMVLPDALRGKSSIHYVNEEDRDRPKSQSYRNFGEIGLSL
jgi:hypothetical protein